MNVCVIISEVFITQALGWGERRKNRKVERGVVIYVTDVTKKLCPLVLLSSIAVYAQSRNPEIRVNIRYSLIS